jgi:hypothetical protein
MAAKTRGRIFAATSLFDDDVVAVVMVVVVV